MSRQLLGLAFLFSFQDYFIRQLLIPPKYSHIRSKKIRHDRADYMMLMIHAFLFSMYTLLCVTKYLLRIIQEVISVFSSSVSPHGVQPSAKHYSAWQQTPLNPRRLERCPIRSRDSRMTVWCAVSEPTLLTAKYCPDHKSRSRLGENYFITNEVPY
jgi:hypothetical protein